MSALFGIVNFNSPLDPSKLEKMKEPMLYWGPDGQYLWHEENAGFGQLQLFNTPESKNEKFPLIDTNRGLIFFSAGRIDNRQGLFDLLDIPNERKISITDAELMFNAYGKWDIKCTEHLLGDWIFLVWHKTEKKLVIIRDHHGISGLYYYLGKDFLVFSSSLKGILALPEVPKEVNELRIAQILISWPGDGKNTAYKDIHRLPPAHFLTFKNKELLLKQYWFLEQKDLGIKKNEEYIEAFSELFTEAVRCRLRSVGKVGSSLSSGLDSSSVSVVAANILKEKGIRLPVFTSAPKYDCSHLFPNRITDESILAAKTVEFNGNMDHYIFRSENTSVLEAIKKALLIHDQPIHAAGNAYWIQDMLGLAKSVGCTTFLTGQGGNGTISWPTLDYTKWYQRAKYPELTFLNLTNFKLFKQRIVRPLIPESLIKLARQLKNGKEPWLKNSAINPEFTERIELKAEMKKAGFNPNFEIEYDPLKSKLQIIKPGRSIGGNLWLENGASYSLEVRDPTEDLRLIEFCFSVPEWIFISKTHDRMLIRKLMENYIPNEVLWHSKRGLQANDIRFRVHNEINFFKSIEKNLCNTYEMNFLNNITFRKKISKMTLLSHTETISLLTRGVMFLFWLENYNSKD